jgi:hypothetical protein
VSPGLRAVEIVLGTIVAAGVLYAVVAALTACSSQEVAENTPGVVESVKGVLSATGLGAFNPLVDSVGKLVCWIAGPPVAAGACAYHKYRGIPFVGSRRRELQETDRDWDDALLQLEDLAGSVEKVAKAGGHEHVTKQAKQAQDIVKALLAKDPQTKKRKTLRVNPTPQEPMQRAA